MKARANFVAIANDLGACDKALELNEATYLSALGLLVLAICYCDRQRTDGTIPANAMRRAIAPGVDLDGALHELVRVGFLDETPSGWAVTGYLDWQRSASEIEAAIEQRRAAGAKGGKAKAHASRTFEPEIDKTEPPTDRDRYNDSPSDSLGDSPDAQEAPAGGGDQLESVRALSGNALSIVDVESLVQQYGIDRVKSEADRLANDQSSGLEVGNWLALLKHRLTSRKPIPASTPSKPRLDSCSRCGGSGRDFDEATGEDLDSVCPECSGAKWIEKPSNR